MADLQARITFTLSRVSYREADMIYSRMTTDVVPDMKGQDPGQMNLGLMEVIGSLLTECLIGCLSRIDAADACYCDVKALI
jgi:hypothetical protein